jgi:hypothetical protein
VARSETSKVILVLHDAGEIVICVVRTVDSLQIISEFYNKSVVYSHTPSAYFLNIRKVGQAYTSSCPWVRICVHLNVFSLIKACIRLHVL